MTDVPDEFLPQKLRDLGRVEPVKPGAAFVVLAATLGSVGSIPVASIALVLGIHRLLAEALTFVNLVGNSLATIVVARWDGALDQETLHRQIGRRRLR